MRFHQTIAIRVAFVLSATIITSISVADWPTYRHDNRRSGVTDEKLTFPLEQTWLRESEQPPQAAWTGPAKWDAWSSNSGLQSLRNFDPCFYVTVKDGIVFYGSSVDDAVHALDSETGKESWVYFTGAAVRFPPTIDQNRAYFGSDDGNAYCCDAKTGQLVWRKQAAPADNRITSNRKIISLWPVRTGVLVQNGKACFAASLVPWETSLLWNVDATTGDEDGDGCFRQEVKKVTLQGALLASSDRIYAPQGRAAPLSFELATGESAGWIGESGGVFCVLTEDEMLFAGPPDQKAKSDEIRIADGKSRRQMASFSGTNRILVAGDRAWVPADGKLKMLNRGDYVDADYAITKAESAIGKLKIKLKKEAEQKDEQPDQQVIGEFEKQISELEATVAEAKTKRQNAWRWEIECPHPNGFIKAGNAILLGLNNEVRAYAAEDGKHLWSAEVDGTAHGLAAADGRLYVSTGRGHIYAFGRKK